MDSWEEFDQMVNSDITRHEEARLKGFISILEVKEIIDENTSLENIKQILHKEFNVEFNLEAIENYFVDEAIMKQEPWV